MERIVLSSLFSRLPGHCHSLSLSHALSTTGNIKTPFSLSPTPHLSVLFFIFIIFILLSFKPRKEMDSVTGFRNHYRPITARWNKLRVKMKVLTQLP